jgi:DNA-binding CsgD family transcriptional regulator
VNEIAGAVARAMLGLAATAGVDQAPLVEGLGFDQRSVEKLKRVSWDDYCVLIQRTAVAVGGVEQLCAITAAHYTDALPPEARIVFRSLISPRLLYRFIFTAVNPAAMPSMTFDYRELPDGRLHIATKLREYVRSSFEFHRCSVGAVEGMPLHLGLPHAQVEVLELTDRALRLLVRLPASQTLLARVRRTSAADLRDASLYLMTLFADNARVRGDSLARQEPAPPRAVQPETQERVRRTEDALGLTRRQAEVLALAVHGLSNKEIASELGCAENTVELHVTQLLKKSRAQGRVQLVARFWTDQLRRVT